MIRKPQVYLKPSTSSSSLPATVAVTLDGKTRYVIRRGYFAPLHGGTEWEQGAYPHGGDRVAGKGLGVVGFAGGTPLRFTAAGFAPLRSA